MNKRNIFYPLLLLLFVACTKTDNASKKASLKPQVENNYVGGKHGLVVSNHTEASKIGIQILKQGGNVFDAMISVTLALSVSYPHAGSLISGGFLVYRTKNGKFGALDFREKAPLKADRDMYLDDKGNVIDKKSTYGALSVGVPGTVAAIFEIYNKHASLSLNKLFDPVIKLARNGYIVSKYQAIRLKRVKEALISINKNKDFFLALKKEGDTIRNEPLAKTLEKLRDNGAKEFYEGETGKTMVKYLNKYGGIMTLEDLKKYKVVWRKPVVYEYKELKLVSMPPPSSGGIAIAQILKMIEPYNVSQYPNNSTKYMQVVTEAERRAFADRTHYLGDPDFNNIPIHKLIDNNYLKERMATFSFDHATPTSKVKYGDIPEMVESDETTHFTIVDSYGNAIAVTTTLNGSYGSKLYCEPLGVFYNNQMDDFSAKPGTPNMFGLVGAEANSIAPEKRMLSSMSPTIVEKNGKLLMGIGAVGGSRIITSVLQGILNVYEYGMPMHEAINTPRFHHQWKPDVIRVEEAGFKNDTLKKLEHKGYKIKKMPLRSDGSAGILGKANAILVRDDNMLEAGYLNYADDAAFGY